MDPNTMANAVEDDLPLPPPKCVADAIPDWDACGKEGCGRHDHRSLEFPLSDLAQNDSPLLESIWTCADCAGKLTMSKMHVLECGHKLCRRCLNDRAWACHNDILNNLEIIDNLVKLADEIEQASSLPVFDVEYAAEMMASASSWRLDAFDLTGFACCGQLSGLQRFIHCMDPDAAKVVWLDFYYLLTRSEDRLQCGWPDCQWFVPLQCSYRREGSCRWYCVWCSGNSQTSGSDGIPASCPAR